MDTLTFASKITESLAWPLVALILGLTFRKRLLDLLPSMKKFKAGPVEAEFELAAKQVLADASKASATAESATIPEEPHTENPTKEIVTELLSARTDPAGMILEGWAKVDGELHKLGRQIGLIDDPLESTAKVYRKIAQQGELPFGTQALVRELRDLRNQVAHAKVVPTADAAQSYLVAVDRVLELIRNYRKNIPNYGPDNR